MPCPVPAPFTPLLSLWECSCLSSNIYMKPLFLCAPSPLLLSPAPLPGPSSYWGFQEPDLRRGEGGRGETVEPCETRGAGRGALGGGTPKSPFFLAHPPQRCPQDSQSLCYGSEGAQVGLQSRGVCLRIGGLGRCGVGRSKVWGKRILNRNFRVLWGAELSVNPHSFSKHFWGLLCRPMVGCACAQQKLVQIGVFYP